MLGSEFEGFADKVGPAFDKIIQTYLDQKFGETRAASSQEAWTANVDKFMEEYVLTPDIETVMSEMMADSPPNVQRPGFNAQRYLTRIYNNATEELGLQPRRKTSKKSESRDEVPDFRVEIAPKTISVEAAVDAALKGIRFKKSGE
jgi:hypothetical protein